MTPRPSLFDQGDRDGRVFTAFDAHAPHAMRQLDVELFAAGALVDSRFVGAVWRGAAPRGLSLGDGSNGFSGESAPAGAARQVIDALIDLTRGPA